MGDAGDKESSVGGVDERSRGTVEFSQEDEEEGEGSRLGKVAVGTDGALELGLIFRVDGGLAVVRAAHLVGTARAEVDAGAETLGHNVGGEVRVVAGKEGRVCQRGLQMRVRGSV